MDRAELVELSLRVAGGLPAVTQGQPFGEGAEVFKVVRKVFAIVDTSELVSPEAALPTHSTPAPALAGSFAAVTLKCAPPHGRALVAEHPDIIPGYHMNKEHWISLCPGGELDSTLAEDLIGNSYDIVVSLLPRAKRPLP